MIHNCVSAHRNSFSEASSDIRCSLKAQVTGVFEPTIHQPLGTIYECPCPMDKDHHNCTSSGNNREWKLKCRKSTDCSPKTATCYKCDLESTRTKKCCDGDLTIDGGKIPSTFICKDRGCPQNCKSGKTGRYHKKTYSQQILIF